MTERIRPFDVDICNLNYLANLVAFVAIFVGGFVCGNGFRIVASPLIQEKAALAYAPERRGTEPVSRRQYGQRISRRWPAGMQSRIPLRETWAAGRGQWEGNTAGIHRLGIRSWHDGSPSFDPLSRPGVEMRRLWGFLLMNADSRSKKAHRFFCFWAQSRNASASFVTMIHD